MSQEFSWDFFYTKNQVFLCENLNKNANKNADTKFFASLLFGLTIRVLRRVVF